MDKNLNLEEAIRQNSILNHKILGLEKKIKEHEAGEDIKNRLIEVFRSTPQLMAISNLIDGTYIDVNKNFLKTLGYKRGEIINKNSGEIQLFADIVQSDKFIRKLSKLKKVEKFPVTLRTKSGETRDFLFSAETMFFGEEKYLLTTYSEVYDDDKASVKLNETLENLRYLFASLSNFVMIISSDTNGRNIIESINPLSKEFNGVQENKIILKDLGETNIENKNIFLELISKINLTGIPHKQTLVADGIEDEGYYFGIKLTSGEIAILWEPGKSYKLKEKELLMQGDIFERFADLLPDMIFEINTRGELVYANSQGLKKFGYTQKDVAKGITIRTIFGDEHLKKMYSNLKKIKEPADTMHNEYEARRKDGAKIFVQTHVFGLFDNKNKLTGFRGVLTDITEKQKIKDEIEREKTHLAVLIESAPESIIQTSTDGIILFANHEFLREFQFTKEEVIGKNIDELIVPPGIRDEGVDLTLKASGNETVSIETIRQKKNGEKIFVSLLINPIIINEKVTGLFAIYRNITDKKQISETRNVIYNISNAALTITEFTDIYSIIKNEISKIWDTKNFYIVLYDKDTQTLSLPFYSDEKDKFDKVPIKGTLTGWLIKNKKPNLLTESDIEVLEKSGETILVGTPCKVWLGVPLIIDNDIIGAMVLQDYEDKDAFNMEDLRLLTLIGNQIALVIQRKKLMANLIEEKRKAEEAVLLKQQFMSTLSHEIRTPLNEVIGITNLLLQGKPRDDQMEFIKTLRFSGNHLLTLVNDVLDYSKMESGMIVFEKTPFNIFDFINDLKRSYSFKADDKKVEFRVVPDKNLPIEIIGDPIRLNQVLSNLLSNAFKFTHKGFVTLSANQVLRNAKSIEIEFSVEDTGIGIPAEKQKIIFDSYTQAADDTTRKYGGTGLGLSICKRLIELQNGSIKIESKLGKGSRFSFVLRYIISEEERIIKKRIDTDEELFDKLTGKKLLIAEDNKINFFVANKFLIKWGIVVTHAENGEIALELLNKNNYDIVLMDLHMPVMDGIEATEIIRASDVEKIKNMPIVALTAAIMSEHQDKIEGLNINDYILKPFKPKELYDKILKHCR